MEIEQIENEPLSEQIDKWEIYSRLKGISAENLTFAYDRDKVLKNASLYINKGDFVMISGASGVGKSTLIKLLMGVYSPDDGELYADLNDEKVSFGVGTRSLFSFVPQGNMIFSGTLRDNVTFIKSDASEKEIENALRISEAESFIKELPKGLDTVVGEDGVGLSEGQVQRIAIARAVLANRPIMLLDESTSALDEETERKVLDNLKTLKDITLIIISHKKAAAKICNRKIKVRDKKFIEETI
jgi:ATP-binding cassette subfamily B protein